MDIKGIRRLLKEFYTKWKEDRAADLGASLSFYSVFSLIPALIVIIGIGGILLDESIVKQSLRAEAGSFIDKDALDWLDRMLDNWQSASFRSVGIPLGIVLILFGASRIFSNLQNSLNLIFKCPNKKGLRGMVRKKLLSFAMLLIISLVLLAFMVISSSVAFINGQLGFDGTLIARIFDILLSLGVATTMFTLLFWMLPNHKTRARNILLGAFSSACLFTIGRFLVSFYMAKINISSYFGAAGFFIVLILWVYYTSLVTLAGAELAYVHSLKHLKKEAIILH